MKNLSTRCALALCIFLAGSYQGHAQSKDQTFDARHLIGGRTYVFTLRNGDDITAVLDYGFAAFIFEGGSFALPLASYALRF